MPQYSYSLPSRLGVRSDARASRGEIDALKASIDARNDEIARLRASLVGAGGTARGVVAAGGGAILSDVSSSSANTSASRLHSATAAAGGVSEGSAGGPSMEAAAVAASNARIIAQLNEQVRTAQSWDLHAHARAESSLVLGSPGDWGSLYMLIGTLRRESWTLCQAKIIILSVIHV